MRKHATALFASLLLAAMPLASQAAAIQVEGGQTSVLFGNGALNSIGLQITGVGGPVIAPGSLGPNSVAFPINARNATSPLLPTTFIYDDTAFAPFSGTIEHDGSVSFTDVATQTASVTVGNFTIGFAGDRSDGNPAASGFFVQDNLDTGAILFDITDPIVEPFDNSLVIGANIAISPEFDGLLQSLGLVSGSVAGVDAGMALVAADSAVVPVPAAAWLFGSALALLGWVRARMAA